MVVYFISAWHHVSIAKYWPTAKGKICSSGVSMSEDLEDTIRNKRYRTSIKYKYVIDGKEYFSEKVYFGDWLEISSSSFMRKVVGLYKAGDECSVHYHPRKPQKSMLIVRVTPPVYALLFLGVAFMVAGMCFIKM